MFHKSSFFLRVKESRNGQFGGFVSSQSSQRDNVRHKKINMLNEGDTAITKSVALNPTIGVHVKLLFFFFLVS